MTTSWPAPVVFLCALGTVIAGCGQGDLPAAAEPQPAIELAERARNLGFTRDPAKSLVRACDEAKPRNLGAAVCPPPWVPQGTTTAAGFDFADVDAEDAVEVEAQSPDGVPYHQLGHWLFGNGPRSKAKVIKKVLALETASSERATSVAGVPARLWLIPTQMYGGRGMHRGHAVVTWSQRGRFYWTSFHDPRNAPRARLLAEVLIAASDE